MSEIVISKAEEELSDNIFARLSGLPLVDQYEAYQLLDNEWSTIAVDLEIIQTEGFGAVKRVEPNYVIKKKNGKDCEVQAGFKGHILPFELVQTAMLAEDYERLKKKEQRLSEIPSELDELLESMSEDERELCKDALNEDGSGFVNKEVPKAVKELKREKAPLNLSCAEKLKRADELIRLEKSLKSEIKTDSSALEAKTKECIEGLSDDNAIALLKLKWIDKLYDELMQLPQNIIAALIDEVSALGKKYTTTLSELEEEIAKTEKELAAMVDELCGNEFDMLGLAELKALFGGL